MQQLSSCKLIISTYNQLGSGWILVVSGWVTIFYLYFKKYFFIRIHLPCRSCYLLSCQHWTHANTNARTRTRSHAERCTTWKKPTEGEAFKTQQVSDSTFVCTEVHVVATRLLEMKWQSTFRVVVHSSSTESQKHFHFFPSFLLLKSLFC